LICPISSFCLPCKSRPIEKLKHPVMSYVLKPINVPLGISDCYTGPQTLQRLVQRGEDTAFCVDRKKV
jgi:hypothetical protein